jgi:hypothetical protein
MGVITYSKYRRNPVTEATNLGLGSAIFVNNDPGLSSDDFLLKTGDTATGDYTFNSFIKISNNSATMLMLDRANTSYDGGLGFTDDGVGKWYMFQGNGGNDLNIQQVGVDGGAYPRIRLSGSTKDIYLACSGGSTFIGSHIGSNTFTSGFAGSGWKMDTTSDVSLTIDNLYVRKSMYVYELVINKIRCTNGSLWVSDACKIDHVVSSTIYIDTDGGNMTVPFVVNDIIRCQRWTGRTIKYYTATVNSVDGSGAYFTFTVINGSDAPAAGDEIVRVGNSSVTSRQGALYLTSSDSNAPYMDILDGVTGYSFAGKTKVRLGKLDGITDAIFGALSGYGLYSSITYLTGSINATAGYIGGFTIDAAEGLYSGTGATRVQMKAGVGIWTGATAFASGHFRVGCDGELFCDKATIKTASSSRRIELIDSDHSLNLYTDNGSTIQLNSTRIPSLYIRDSTNTYSTLLKYDTIDINNSGSTSRFYVVTGAGTLSVAMQASSYVNLYIDLPDGATSGETGPTWKNVVVNINTGRICRAS